MDPNEFIKKRFVFICVKNGSEENVSCRQGTFFYSEWGINGRVEKGNEEFMCGPDMDRIERFDEAKRCAGRCGPKVDHR